MQKALDALTEYRTADGGFSHIGGETSGISTVEALQAHTALELSRRGESLYCISAKAPTDIVTNESVSEPQMTEETVTQADADSEKSASGNDIRIILAVASAAAGLILIVVWLVRGRKRMLFIAAGGVLIVLAVVIALADIRTPEEYYADREDTGGITVTVSADCTEALQHPEKAQRALELPEDGYVIALAEIALPEGSTAFDALIAASKEQKISVDHTASAMGAYVSGIGVLYELDYGSESGWLYYVNG